VNNIFNFLREHEVFLMLIPVIVFGAIIYFYGFDGRGAYDGEAEVFIEKHSFRVDVADTPLERQQGLSGTKSLRLSNGLLFVFGKSSIQRFWMKDMLIPIDIIWINDGKIVGFVENVQPEPGVSLMKLKRYSSPVPVNYVLEVSAGTVNRIGASVGDAVTIRL